MKAIYRFEGDCGRMGTLFGLFVAEKDDVKRLIETGVEVYFGEVLGKHSDISGPIDEKEITMISDDPALVAKVEELDMAVGFNPVRMAADQAADAE